METNEKTAETSEKEADLQPSKEKKDTEEKQPKTRGVKNASKSKDVLVFSRPAPPPEKRHDISDEQLQMLLDCSRDGLSDKMYLAWGAALGLVPSVLSELLNVWFANPKIPFGGLLVIQLMLLAIACTAGLIIALVSKGRSSRAKL